MNRGYVATYPLSTVKDWCLTRGVPYTALIPERVGYTYGPCYGPEPGVGLPTAFEEPEAYIAEISDCEVVGGRGIVLTSDNRALLDSAFGPRADRFDLNDGALTMIPGGVRVQAAGVSEQSIGEGILLQSFFASNYHHWIVEHLPRLLIVEMANVPPTVPMLVDGTAMAIEQLSDALRAVTDRPVIPLEWGVRYHVNRLIVPSQMFGTGPNLQRGLEVEIGDVTVSRLAIEWLRKRLAPTEPGKARIYIDRRAVMAPVRLLNGDDVERTFADFGFETVHPAEMSFAEQRDVFGNAAYIAGETSAAMTNVLLAPSSTVMICMQARRWPLNIYADLCTYGGQRNLFFVGEPATGEADGTDGRTYQIGFRMDADLLRNRLRDILGG